MAHLVDIPYLPQLPAKSHLIATTDSIGRGGGPLPKDFHIIGGHLLKVSMTTTNIPSTEGKMECTLGLLAPGTVPQTLARVQTLRRPVVSLLPPCPPPPPFPAAASP